jgi:hypothetical protein
MESQEDYKIIQTEEGGFLPIDYESGLPPYFQLFSIVSIVLFVLLFFPSVYFLLIGFGLRGGANAETYGWGRMFGLLCGLIFLMMALAFAGCNLLLISYRRKAAFKPARPWPILLSAGISFLIGAAFIGLMYSFFGLQPILLAASIVFFLHGIFGMLIALRPSGPKTGNETVLENSSYRLHADPVIGQETDSHLVSTGICHQDFCGKENEEKVEGQHDAVKTD